MAIFSVENKYLGIVIDFVALAAFGLTTFFLVFFFWRQSVLLTGLLLALSALALFLWRDWRIVALYVFCATMGYLAESSAVYYGVWRYTKPDLTYTPYWLPVLWGLATLFIARSYFIICRIFDLFMQGKQEAGQKKEKTGKKPGR